MSAWAGPVVGLVAGAVLGLAYFGGLLVTVRRLRDGAGPGLLALSLLARLALVAAALVLLVRWSPAAVAAALVGLVAVRVALTRRPDRWLEGSRG